MAATPKPTPATTGTATTTAKPGLRERNRARTYADIAGAALDLFERQGYDTTTVDQISMTAGVSPATFFRYFATKEDVLFATEHESAREMVERVATRTDRRNTSIAALADPVTEFAEAMLGPQAPNIRRMTTLVMTTPSLAPRSLRMRLRWERDIAAELARESGLDAPELAHTVVASVAISCLASGLRYWPGTKESHTLGPLVRAAFGQLTG